MSIKFASWVHGTTLQIEADFPVEVIRRGWGTIVRSPGGQPWSVREGSTFWLHFGIPTPVIVDDKRLRLDSILVDYDAGNMTELTYIDVWDSGKKILETPRKSRVGIVGRQLQRFPLPEHPLVEFGIGVSIGIQTGELARTPWLRNETSFQIMILGVGADFSPPGLEPLSPEYVALQTLTQRIARKTEYLLESNGDNATRIRAGNYTFVMNPDGNFTLHDLNGNLLWQSGSKQ